ncbi:MAG: hypothetical protein COS68_03865 [Elusimicrobia bacterium CG06_land_8_20_14_3_00_38_11]|nr:MAG: hypothetical protein COS68_03865 [Elusimicrobia bacterium CG06_land_8_20_14_3_00_38_11]
MAETVGSLADKISIIQLKIYHMNEQLARKDADNCLKKMVIGKIKVLKIQKKDLETELSELFKNLVEGKIKLKVYWQFKMYNDPKYRIKNV